jgi:hypothetical protein
MTDDAVRLELSHIACILYWSLLIECNIVQRCCLTASLNGFRAFHAPSLDPQQVPCILVLKWFGLLLHGSEDALTTGLHHALNQYHLPFYFSD